MDKKSREYLEVGNTWSIYENCGSFGPIHVIVLEITDNYVYYIHPEFPRSIQVKQEMKHKIDTFLRVFEYNPEESVKSQELEAIRNIIE